MTVANTFWVGVGTTRLGMSMQFGLLTGTVLPLRWAFHKLHTPPYSLLRIMLRSEHLQNIIISCPIKIKHEHDNSIAAFPENDQFHRSQHWRRDWKVLLFHLRLRWWSQWSWWMRVPCGTERLCSGQPGFLGLVTFSHRILLAFHAKGLNAAAFPFEGLVNSCKVGGIYLERLYSCVNTFQEKCCFL